MRSPELLYKAPKILAKRMFKNPSDLVAQLPLIEWYEEAISEDCHNYLLFTFHQVHVEERIYLSLDFWGYDKIYKGSHGSIKKEGWGMKTRILIAEVTHLVRANNDFVTSYHGLTSTPNLQYWVNENYTISYNDRPDVIKSQIKKILFDVENLLAFYEGEQIRQNLVNGYAIRGGRKMMGAYGVQT